MASGRRPRKRIAGYVANCRELRGKLCYDSISEASINLAIALPTVMQKITSAVFFNKQTKCKIGILGHPLLQYDLLELE